MLDNLLSVIKSEGVSEQLYHGLVGLEIEENRVNKKGQLSREPHPRMLGSRTFHPYLQTDFAEAQAEVITDPNPNIGGALDQLDTLQTIFYRSLQAGDQIWPLSMPPRITAADTDFIKAHFERPAYADYRNYLTQKYGVASKVMTGAHLNYSIPDPVINRLYTHYEDEFDQVVDFRNALYFRMAQNLVLNEWLLTYLFGASPVAEDGFFDQRPASLSHPVRSIRNSHFGYANLPGDGVDATIYQSLPYFIQHLTDLVDSQKLYSQAEFYGPVRLRGVNQLHDLSTKGVRYLEVRCLDTTPFHSNGISRHALYFMKLLFVYALVTPVDESQIADQLKQAEADNEQVALEEPSHATFKVAEGKRVFQQLHELAVKLNAHTELINAIDDFAEVITHPELTPSAMLKSHLDENDSLMTFGQLKATVWKAKRVGTDQLLPRMSRLSANAQNLIFRAVQLGIRYYPVRDENGAIMLMLTFNSITQVIEADHVTDEPATEYLKRMFPDLPLPETGNNEVN
ncbi:glutamate-cysteine ligase [Secundilactobacillus pentosiphilus]|uniref:Glutamate--cysteine ligase n=1 Tax=Secundilactobacillus pentosiphilus TaxID=1714682 RepID=A0A1Z5IQ15_9LACO|nr:gamma-glutamylcysteine synthetase [Secundilactobacillus pentosiphilus]GAX03796.1 glutamate-cysteine ligase [Secundilactobacillus pentosiphilus]